MISCIHILGTCEGNVPLEWLEMMFKYNEFHILVYIIVYSIFTTVIILYVWMIAQRNVNFCEEQ